jgi:hypothetical protein
MKVLLLIFAARLKNTSQYYIVLCLLLWSSSASAQFHEIGAWGGFAHYFGDLNPNFGMSHPRPAAGVFYRYNLGKRTAIKGQASYGQIEGTDEGSSSAADRQRNLSFRSTVIDVCATFEVNFFKYNKNNPKHNGFTPYIATGFGIFFYNPEAYYKGRWYYLQPLGTEGQNDPSYSGVSKYNLYSFEIPIEGGFKFHLKKNWNFIVFAVMNKTFTKYLDDVSGSYASTASLPGGSHGLAAALADRSDQVDGGAKIGKVGYQRGNGKNDSYAFVGVALSYTFMSLRCPTPGASWPYR